MRNPHICGNSISINTNTYLQEEYEQLRNPQLLGGGTIGEELGEWRLQALRRSLSVSQNWAELGAGRTFQGRKSPQPPNRGLPCPATPGTPPAPTHPHPHPHPTPPQPTHPTHPKPDPNLVSPCSADPQALSGS